MVGILKRGSQSGFMTEYDVVMMNSSRWVVGYRIIKLLDNTKIQAMSGNRPRCPKGVLAKQACVTQKCNASPYMCQSNPACPCHNAHQFCKIMQWSSVVQLLTAYHDNLPDPLRSYTERVDKIYHNIINKINTQIKIFHQFLQQSLYGAQYSKIMHHLSKQDYNKITCTHLGTIISKMTQRVVGKTQSQQGSKNMERFTINQMKNLDNQIGALLSGIQSLYKNKYKIIDFQLRELNKKNSTVSINNKQGTRSQSSVSLHSHKHSNSHINSSNIVKQFPLAESVVLKRTQSVNKNYQYAAPFGTASTNFFTPHKTSAFKNTQFGSTKDTQFWNPQSPIKSDLSYPKSINSRILSNASALNHFIISKVKEYKLIYRASDNNYDIGQFYKKINNHTFHNQISKKPHETDQEENYTLLLLKTQFGKVVGGFTNLKWSKQSNLGMSDDEQQYQKNTKTTHYKSDIRGLTFIFSVDLNQKYQLLDPKFAIYCSSKGIGFGKSDIRIVNNCHKHAKNYIGFPNSYNNGLYLPIKKSSLLLNGSHDSVHFKVPQWEMFQVLLHQKRRRDKSNSIKCQIQLQKSEVSINIQQSKLKSQRKQK